MTQAARTQAETDREAKTWLFVALASIALLMFVAGFVLVLT